MKKNIIHTLWTGGLDSTARIVYLSRQDVNIVPYYMIDSARASNPYELRAMERIIKRLRNDNNTIAKIEDVVIVNVKDIQEDTEITNAWKRLYDKYRVGSQYEWLARYAKQEGITLEIVIEKGDGRAQTSILKESKMIVESDVTGNNYLIDRNYKQGDVWTLYNRFRFPLWETSKADEITMMNNYGCNDIVKMTWFCHSPLFGKPCGHCNPCKDAYHYNLGWRIPRINYYLWYLIHPKQLLKSLIAQYTRR